MPNPLECLLSLAVTFSFLLGLSFLFNVAYAIKRYCAMPKNIEKQENKKRYHKKPSKINYENALQTQNLSKKTNNAFTRKKPQIALKETVRSKEDLSHYLKN